MKKVLTRKFKSIIKLLETIFQKGGRSMGSKLDELIMYISQRSKDDPNFGFTKLNKILFAADFYFFGHFGRSISGSRYMHLDRGPAPMGMRPALDSLVSSGRIKIKQIRRISYDLNQIVPLDDPDITKFSQEEIEFVDRFVEIFKGNNGTELSAWTHTLVPWLITKNKEEIPYQSIFTLHDLPIDRPGIDWAMGELNRLRSQEGYEY